MEFFAGQDYLILWRLILAGVFHYYHLILARIVTLFLARTISIAGRYTYPFKGYAVASLVSSQPGKTRTPGWTFRALPRNLARSTPSWTRSFSMKSRFALGSSLGFVDVTVLFLIPRSKFFDLLRRWLTF